MLAEDILAQHAVRKERESFKKRKSGLVKKTEQLRRVWPFCDIEQKIIDRATGQWYLYRSTNEDFPSISHLQEHSPGTISELLGPEDFTTDDEDSNNDNDDGDSGGEAKVLRRKMKNIRQKRRSRQNTPKKKPARELPRASAPRIAQPSFLIKDILSRDEQDQIGTRRITPSGSRRLKADARKGEKDLWALPPIPILKSCDKIPTDSDVPEMVL